MFIEPSVLIAEIKNGNRLMFTLCYEQYHKGLYLFAFKYTHDEAAAQDIIQDVFVKLWSMRNTLNTKGNLTAWLYSITKNHTLNFLRNRRNALGGNTQYYNQQSDLHTPEPEPVEVAEQLQWVVGELPERQRMIFDMKINESLTNQEIADRLNLSVNTVKVHYSRTMKHLCQRLKQKK